MEGDGRVSLLVKFRTLPVEQGSVADFLEAAQMGNWGRGWDGGFTWQTVTETAKATYCCSYFCNVWVHVIGRGNTWRHHSTPN